VQQVSTHAPDQDAGHELVHEFAKVVGGGVTGIVVRAVLTALLEVLIAAGVVRTAVVSLDVVVAGVAVLIVVLDGVVVAQHCAPLLASVAHNAGVSSGFQADLDTWAWIHS
jgi:hypothetical protein